MFGILPRKKGDRISTFYFSGQFKLFLVGVEFKFQKALECPQNYQRSTYVTKR